MCVTGGSISGILEFCFWFNVFDFAFVFFCQTGPNWMSASFQMPAPSFRGGVALIAVPMPAAGASPIPWAQVQLQLKVRVIPVLICAQDAHQSCVCVCVECVCGGSCCCCGAPKRKRGYLLFYFTFVGVGGQAFCCCRRFSAKGVAVDGTDRQADRRVDGQTDKTGGHDSQLWNIVRKWVAKQRKAESELN